MCPSMQGTLPLAFLLCVCHCIFITLQPLLLRKNLNGLKFSGDLKSGLVDYEWLKRGWVEYGTDFK